MGLRGPEDGFMVRHISFPMLLALAGCPVGDHSFDEDKGYSGDTGEGNGGTGDPSDTDTDTDSDSDSDDDSGYNFDVPGDWVDFDADSSPKQISLSDESGDSNQEQLFFLVLVNPEEDEGSYVLRYTVGSRDAEKPMPSSRARERVASSPSSPQALNPNAAKPPVHYRDALEDSDVGTREDEFRVRNNVEKTDEFDVKDATLWALGEKVAIWVDNEVPIDWDMDCDGVVDVEHPYETFGFTNCDLNLVADIIDLNIIPNVTGLFGDVSDIDGDGRIDLFITPELNMMPTTSKDEDQTGLVLRSYAEPAVDLAEYNSKSNPGSDEREVIYAYAPDPAGFYHEGVPVSIEEYTNYGLAAEVARSLVSLVSYNQHVMEAGSSTVMSDWYNDALGTLAADRCGFGAAYHEDAWHYLDAPYLQPLLAESTKGSLNARKKGAQYLFAVWLWDWVDGNIDPTVQADFWADLVQTEELDEEALVAALETAGVSDVDFDDLVVAWQVGAMTTGVLKEDGNALAKSDVTTYSDPEFLSSDPSARDNLYGANGYQRGIDLHGDNYAFQGGDTDSPEVLPEQVVRLENTDFFQFDPAFSYDGWIDGGYAAQVVRLQGIPYDAAALEVQFGSGTFKGAIVRWNDPPSDDYVVENIFSPLDSSLVTLPPLLDDGTPIYALGELTGEGTVQVFDPDGDEETESVQDTDRYLLDLTDRTALEMVTLDIWLDRRFDDEGNSQPEDPWIAVAPREWLPTPTYDTLKDSDTCGDIEFQFPDSVLEYLYFQQILSDVLGEDADEEDFDAVGTPTDPAPDCTVDYDGDGVLDEDEPEPQNFIEQVIVQQYDYYGGTLPSGMKRYGEEWCDVDELDDDASYTFSARYNTGGAAGQEGEEAFLRLTLAGGSEYVVVVGGNEGAGIYELSLRVIE